MASFCPLVHRLSPATKARTPDRTCRLAVAQAASSSTITMKGHVTRRVNGTGFRSTGCSGCCNTSMDWPPASCFVAGRWPWPACPRDVLHNSLRSVIARSRAVRCVAFFANSRAIGCKKSPCGPSRSALPRTREGYAGHP